MTRAYPLTDAQKTIIENNLELFDAQLIELEGMKGTTLRQVRDYRRRITRPPQSEHAQLAELIEQYILKHGLPQQYGAVLSWARYLRQKG